MLAAEEVGGELSTGDYLSQWLRHSRGRLRSKTFEGYQGVIRLYATPGIGEVPLCRLHPLHLQQLYSSLMERGLAGGTVLNLHLVLHQALAQAVRWGLIERSPAAGAVPPRPKRPEPVLVDPALASRILAAVAGTRMELPAALALARSHDLRHGHATLLVLSRVHPKVVSERLGHASVGITLDTYSHVLPSMQSEAARAIDDLFAPGG